VQRVAICLGCRTPLLFDPRIFCCANCRLEFERLTVGDVAHTLNCPSRRLLPFLRAHHGLVASGERHVVAVAGQRRSIVVATRSLQGWIAGRLAARSAAAQIVSRLVAIGRRFEVHAVRKYLIALNRWLRSTALTPLSRKYGLVAVSGRDPELEGVLKALDAALARSLSLSPQQRGVCWQQFEREAQSHASMLYSEIRRMDEQRCSRCVVQADTIRAND